MSKRYLLFALFIVGLCVALMLFHSFIYVQLGTAMFVMDSFNDWYILLLLLSLVSLLILLNYYRVKKYRWALGVGIVAGLAGLAQLIAMNYAPVMFMALGTGLIYGLVLIFSETSSRPWLKIAGIVMLVVEGILIITWFRNPGVENIERTHQWTILANSFVPVAFLLNFWSEYHASEITNRDSTRRSLKLTVILMLMGCLLTLAISLFVGQKFGIESYYSIQWNKGAAEREQLAAKPFEARIYVSGRGDTMRYRLFKPEQYDISKRYPLVVCLHHGGAPGKDNTKQVEGSAAPFFYANRTKFSAFLFVPQCPPGTSWSGYMNAPPIDSLVFETIQVLESEFQIDAKRRYVIGGSMGGDGTWYFICTRPDMFAAAIPMSGAGDPKYANAIAKIPVWAFHGAQDKVAPVSGSREMIEAMKKAGGSPRYTEFPDRGHGIGENINTTPGLLEWLFAQKRE